MAAAIRQTLKLGMIPADGIGKEVLPVSRVDAASATASARHAMLADGARTVSRVLKHGRRSQRSES